MAKKGGAQQLQTEINTNDELEKFLQRDGLLILDVYTEWCGPCLAMIGSLKKIKLEQGGDDLQLAIVKCDNIDVFQRFRNKSEPTWLFITNGKLVNSAFGSNVPELMALITKELEIQREQKKDGNSNKRIIYELTELTPVELKRYNKQLVRQEETRRIEAEAALRQRHEYLTFVTNRIMTKNGDCGVTIFFPHIVSRDLFKRVADPAEKCQLIVRDKKNSQILEEHLEVLHFDCDNPMPKYVIDYLLRKDVFTVCWKLNEGETRPIEEILTAYIALIAHDQPIKDEFGNINPDVKTPSLLKSLSLTIETNDDDENEGLDSALEQKAPHEDVLAKEKPIGEQTDDKLENDSDENDDNKEQSSDSNAQPAIPENKESKLNIVESKKKEDPIDGETSIKSPRKVKINVPAAWTPANKRAHAALIYLYFRHITELYLPPDPIPEKPHVAMIYDSYKRKDLMDIIEQFPEDILAYGYFTTDDYTTATLLANSTFAYQKNSPTIHDKMVLKVSKAKPDPILELISMGPSYMSKNSEIGKVECLGFFPIGYIVGSETGEPEPIPEEERPKKKKKKGKHRRETEEIDPNVENENDQPAEQEESDADDDGDDEDDEIENGPNDEQIDTQ